MNAVWNSYGQLCGCPEIFKKSCKFFCRELDIRVSESMNRDFRDSTCFTMPSKYIIYRRIIDFFVSNKNGFAFWKIFC